VEPQAISKGGLGQYVYYTSLLSFNRIKFRVLTGLLTGHNILRRHLFIRGLINSSIYRRCGAEEENSVHIFVSVKTWRHPDVLICIPFSWTLRMLAV